MNILIPKKYKKLQLKETEGMLVAYMLLIATDHGFEHAYNFHSHDLKKILKVTTMAPQGKHLDKLKNIFNFAMWDECNWTVQFKESGSSFLGRKYKGKRRVEYTQFKLKSVRNQNLWCYLLGMHRSSLVGELIETQTERFPHTPTKYGYTMNQFHIDNFRIELDRNENKKKRAVS